MRPQNWPRVQGVPSSGPTHIQLLSPSALAVGAVPVVLGAIGFTGSGIAASSLAAKMMSTAAIANGGGVAAGSLVATLQSVGRCSAGLAGVGKEEHRSHRGPSPGLTLWPSASARCYRDSSSLWGFSERGSPGWSCWLRARSLGASPPTWSKAASIDPALESTLRAPASSLSPRQRHWGSGNRGLLCQPQALLRSPGVPDPVVLSFTAALAHLPLLTLFSPGAAGLSLSSKMALGSAGSALVARIVGL